MTSALAAAAAVLIAAPAHAYLGRSPLPAGLDPADVVLFEDFESATTLADRALAGTRSSVKAGIGFAGSRAIENHAGPDGNFSLRVPLGAAFDVVYGRYMFRVDPAAACTSNRGYHLMGFEGGTESCKGGAYTSSGTDCFTVRTQFNPPYLGVHVEAVPYPGLFNDFNMKVSFADRQWHCFEMRVQLNTPGTKDGEIRHWVDGKETIKGGLAFRTTANLKTTKWWFTNWSNPTDCSPLIIDDLVISRQPIGCPGSPPPVGSPGRDGSPGAGDASATDAGVGPMREADGGGAGGATGTGGGPGGSSVPPADNPADGADKEQAPDGGCGCQLADRPVPPLAAWLLALLGGRHFLRRIRRR